MPGKSLLSDLIAAHTVYRYVGPGYLMGVPARDLTASDLLEVREREGVTRAVIEASGIYEPISAAEVPPFCGAPTGEGGRCKRRVERWGERCYQHQGVEIL
jgi:hypothetical protein